jgi:FlaA1/EpsC-like NDP-sugar epimerase
MNSNQKTVLVTGATGNIGSQVVKQLSSIPGENIRVRAAVRSINDSTSKMKGEGVELVELEFDMGNCCHNHNICTIKILTSHIVYFTYINKWRRNDIYT